MARIGEVYISQRSDSPYILQLIARDMTQLNSDVVAIWRLDQDDDANELSQQILSRRPDFFAHTTVLAGVKRGVWSRIAKASVIDYSEIWFKSAAVDYSVVGNLPDCQASEWHIWRVNEDWRLVPKNLFHNRTYYFGDVYPPADIEHMIDNEGYPPQ